MKYLTRNYICIKVYELHNIVKVKIKYYMLELIMGFRVYAI